MKKTRRFIMSFSMITIAALFFGFNSQKADAAANAWENVETVGFSAGIVNYPSIAFNPSTHEPYVAYKDSGNSAKATVMKFDGTSWINVGTAGFSASSINYIKIAFNPSTNEPYVAYQDSGNSNKATVMRFHNDLWENVGTAGFGAGAANYTNIVFNPSTNEPYVVYDTAIGGKATVMRFHNDLWENVGTAEFSAGAANSVNIAFDPATNEPYVVYQDGGNSYRSTAMKFDGTSWVNVGTVGFSAGIVSYPNIAFNPATNEPYVAYQDSGNSNKSTVMRFNGTSWVNVGTAGFSDSGAWRVVIVFNSSTNEPYVAYKDSGNSDKATVMKFDGTSWVNVGTAGFSAGLADQMNIVFNTSTNEPYVVYKDGGNSDKATVMKFNSNEVVEPVASPAAGTYTSVQSVTLSTTTSGATIYYTTNGDTPTSGSTEYADPISISADTTLKAIAIKSGMTNSEVMSEEYSIVTAKTVDSFSPSTLQQDYSDGLISATGGNPLETSKATFNVPYALDSSSIDITIPSGTEVTRTGGGNLDLTALSTLDATTEINNSGSGYDAPGVIRFGIPNMNLTFSKPVTVSIPVGSAYNGQTLQVYYRNEGSNDWSSQGVNCVVSGGVCTFETSHATYFAAGEKSPGSEDDDKKGSKTERKKYKFYKGLYRNAISKKYYQEVKAVKNTNQDLFIQWKNIFIAHKHDAKGVLEKLDPKTKEIFFKYKNYNGYRNYKIYKEKVT